MKRVMTWGVVCFLFVVSSCKKDAGQAPGVPQKMPESAGVPAASLAVMLQFLHQHAELRRHTEDSTITWWQLEAVLIDGKTVKHNPVFFPTFNQLSSTCQTSREFNFYQAPLCPDQNIIVPFTANVTVYAGNKQFEWRDAPIQWRQNRSTAAACPAEDWGSQKLPKKLVIRVKPKLPAV